MDQQQEKQLLNDDQLKNVTGGGVSGLSELTFDTKREILGKEELIEATKVFFTPIAKPDR